EVLAGIWSEVLGLERAGVTDNFFALGGHSLLATQIVSRVRRAFGTELSLRSLFEQPTVEGLSGIMRDGHGPMPMETALQPVPRDVPLPLSHAQSRLWFLDQLEPGNGFYNMPLGLWLNGRVDVAALERSLNEVVRRHEALRTRFESGPGEPVQAIMSDARVILVQESLYELPADQREIEALRLAEQEATRPFDLTTGPLFRVRLLCLEYRDDQPHAEGKYLFLAVLHHSIADGWSMDILVHELTTLYEAFAAGRPSPLRDLQLQYADFAVWQRLWLRGDVGERQLGYWTERLQGCRSVLELPADRPRPALQTYKGSTYAHCLPDKLRRGLSKLSRAHDVTPFMLLLGAFQVLLSRYSGQTDVCVGTPVANRNRLELEGLIGFFVNTLVLRTDLSGNPVFTELLKQVRDVTLGAQAHQDLPFEQLVEALQPERDTSYSPLFQVMFDWQDTPREDLELPGIQISPLEVGTRSAKFDLTLNVTNTAEGLLTEWEYNTDLFDERTMRRMARYYATLLEGIVSTPRSRLSELPFVTTGELRQLLLDWSGTERVYPLNWTVVECFEAQVERTPEAVALVDEDQALSYRELNARSNRLAHYLRTLGIGPEGFVGLCVERSVMMVVGMLGILKAGGAYLPLDPNYPRERLDYSLRDAAPRVLLTQLSQQARWRSGSWETVCLDRDWEQRMAGQPASNLNLTPGSEQLAYVIYTSGSTGRPKGVAVRHGGMVNHALAVVEGFALKPSDSVLQFASFNFDQSVEEIFPSLLAGATLVLMPAAPPAPGEDLIRFIEKRRISVLHLPTAYWSQWVQEWSRVPGRLPDCLRLINVNSEKVPAERFAAWRRLAADSEVIWFNTYGPTEMTITATWYAYHRGSGWLAEQDEVPIGRPLPNIRAYILDQHLELLPAGIVGQLFLGGAGLARGYLNRPDLTASAFVPDPFGAPGGRLYRSGDLARYRDDGVIEYLGRIDQQVKLRGFRIEPGEIEARLLDHAAVREAVVMLREDRPGEPMLVAYLVAGDGVAPAVLENHLREALPAYMLPSAYVFLPALPLAPNGKVDRRALPQPDGVDHCREEYVAPRTAMEEVLAGIWSEVLGLERAGVTDNFFALGGHSLLAVKLIQRLRQTLGVDYPLVSLFQAPTVAEFVAQSQEHVPDAVTPVVPLRAVGSGEPLFCFDPTGFHLLAYRPLAVSALIESPVYCIATRDLLLNPNCPLPTLKAAAKVYADLIAAKQVNGPYKLLGWSFGAVFAMAVAEALESMGRRVAFVGLLDAAFAWESHVSSDPLEQLAQHLDPVFRDQFRAMEQDARERLRAALSGLDPEKQLEYAVEWARRHGLVHGEQSEEVLKLEIAVAARRARLCDGYVPVVIDAPLSIWSASETVEEEGVQAMNWERYSRPPSWHSTIAGDHSSILQDSLLHRQIGERLRETQPDLPDAPTPEIGKPAIILSDKDFPPAGIARG
ncbi:MAG: amino acid adenylation domain-containing protein, partial [Methylococcales bacterium]